MEKQDLEFKLENMEQANHILNGSDVYEDNFEEISKELNSDNLIRQMKELDSDDSHLRTKYE